MAKTHGSVGAFYVARKWCLYYDGVANDRTEVTDSAFVNFGAAQSFSITMWLRMPPNAGVLGILDKGFLAAPGNNGWIIEVGAAGVIIWSINAGAGAVSVASVGVLDDSAWHCLVCMRDGVTGRLWIYIDGVADPGGGGVGHVGDLSNVTDLAFANKTGGGANTEEVYIGETKFYSTLLTPAEITALWNGGDGLWEVSDPIDTRALWQHREGSGATLHDQSINNQDGTIIGATWVDAGVPVVAGATAGAHPNYTIVAADVNLDAVTLLDGGVPMSTRLYDVTPAGAITTYQAPAGVVTISYSHYVVSEGGAFHQWTLTTEAVEHNVTDFRSLTGWDQFIVGQISWSATAQRFWIHHGLDFNLGDRRHIVKLYFDDAGDNRFEGWAYITGINPSVTVGDVIEESITMRGDDAFEPEYT